MLSPRATQSPPNLIEQTSYSAQPWHTHPIDIVKQPQGWGPFGGPWSPVEFICPQTMGMGGAGIDVTYLQGVNIGATGPINHAPPYAVETIFPDHSLQRVSNNSASQSVKERLLASGYTFDQTIANGRPAGQSSLQRIASALKIRRGTNG